jgi:DNA-binding NarL/FixJ family response regulator
MQVAVQPSSTSIALRVALIDNRPERRNLMRKVVEAGHAGVDVVGEVDTVADAIDVVAAEQVNIVIVEVQLPVDQGLQTIAQLRASYPDLGIVVCSFHLQADTQEQARQHGADIYLAKPIRPRELTEALLSLRPARLV